MVSAADVDRLFLQAVLSRGIMSSDLARVLLGKCIKAVNDSNEALNIRVPHPQDKEAWEEYVVKINKSLDKLDLEFRSLHDELTGREMYALVNRKDDEIAQLATDYSPAEITYFRGIVEQIMLAPHEAYVISSFAALRAPNELGLNNISKSHAEVILASFVAKGWLLKSKSGYYSLSTRSRLELLPYLKSNYADDVLECAACTQIITRGFACPTKGCKGRFHDHCLKNYRKAAKNTKSKSKCPTCNSEWPDELTPVGEKAYRTDGRRRTHDDGSEDDSTDDETQQPSQDSPAPKKKGRRIVKKREDSMDTSGDEEGDENMAATQTQAIQKPRRSGRR